LDQETLAEKNRRLKKLRKRLEEKDKELAALQAQLAQVRSAAYMEDLSYENTPVFFIVGRAKSGTSWLMRLLNAHPEILCRGEGRFFGRDFIREQFKEQDRIQPSSLYRAFLEAEYLHAWIERSVWTRGDDAEAHLINLTRMATGYFLAQRLAKSGKRIVGDKTPLVSADTISEMSVICPNAKVIHIVRDGRDVAVSMVYHRWNRAQDEGGIYELDPEEARRREAYRGGYKGSTRTEEGLFTEKMIRSMASGWRKQISKTREDGRTLLGVNYAEVKYEDLLERPEEGTEQLLAFLGADASEEVVSECVRTASFENWTDGRGRGQEDPYSFFRKGVAGDWKNVFTEQDKLIFKEEAGDLLIELGYEKDNDW
jgi:hypothetical protein